MQLVPVCVMRAHSIQSHGRTNKEGVCYLP